MATYRKISGVNVKSYSTDPDRTYPSGMEGKLYYNSSDGQFKFVGLGAGAWATGADQNTGKQLSGSVGTSTAALAIGGYNDPGRAFSHGDSGSLIVKINGVNVRLKPSCSSNEVLFSFI